MADLPASLKPFKTFLRQASQVEKVNAKAAYYARLYVVMSLMDLPKEDRDATVNKFVTGLLTRLEKDKETLQLDADTDRVHVEDFAMKVFDFADKSDRDEKADLQVVKAYLTASVFLDVLHYFDKDPGADITQRIKFARWRATEISHAIKEGRKPVPVDPLPVEHDESAAEADDDHDQLRFADNDEFKATGTSGPANLGENYSTAPTAASAPPVYSSDEDAAPQTAAAASSPSPPPPPPAAYRAVPPSKPLAEPHRAAFKAGGASVALQQASAASIYAYMNEAEKCTKEALAALRFNDYNAAETRLTKALENVRILQRNK